MVNIDEKLHILMNFEKFMKNILKIQSKSKSLNIFIYSRKNDDFDKQNNVCM